MSILSARPVWAEAPHGLGRRGSIGTVGDALDNVLWESTIGLFKTEAIHAPSWRDRAPVEWQVAPWVHWYNATRRHSSIGHLPRLSPNSDTGRLRRRPQPGGRLNNPSPASQDGSLRLPRSHLT